MPGTRRHMQQLLAWKRFHQGMVREAVYSVNALASPFPCCCEQPEPPRTAPNTTQCAVLERLSSLVGAAGREPAQQSEHEAFVELLRSNSPYDLEQHVR